MRKKDLKVGDIVEIQKGKYSGTSYGMIVSLDGDAVRKAQASERERLGLPRTYFYRDRTDNKSAVVYSHMRVSPETRQKFSPWGDLSLMENWTEVVETAQWNAPSTVRLQHITNVMTPEDAASQVQVAKERAKAHEERLNQYDHIEVQMKERAARANTALGLEAFSVVRRHRTRAPEFKLFADGYDAETTKIGKIVERLAQIDQNIENMMIEVSAL